MSQSRRLAAILAADIAPSGRKEWIFLPSQSSG